MVNRNGSHDAPAAALELISAHTVMSLSTVVDRTPHAVSLMYAHVGFALYWVSDPDSRHSLALEKDPAAAVTIADHFSDFREIVGLQMHGLGTEVRDPGEAEEGLELLKDRYGFLERFFVSGPLELARRLGKASVYRFVPEEVTLVDNSMGFGHKDVFRPVDAG